MNGFSNRFHMFGMHPINLENYELSIIVGNVYYIVSIYVYMKDSDLCYNTRRKRIVIYAWPKKKMMVIYEFLSHNHHLNS